MAIKSSNPSANERRTAEFHPTVWGDFFLARVFSDRETVNGWMAGIEALKGEVKAMMSAPAPTTEKLSEKQLHLIDVVERLGIGYHFEAEIDEQLRQVYNGMMNRSLSPYDDEDQLFTTALRFRLLRQHRYNVPSDIFNRFKNEEGRFDEKLENDVQGMMSLYEAAYLQMPGETILEEAMEFAEGHLTKYTMADGGDDQYDDLLSKRIAHMLKRPLRKGVEKHEQLFFIWAYEQEKGHNQTLLKLAKLSWNHLQHMYQQELRSLTKWWIDLDFVTKLPFARDRLIEIYFWAVGAMWEPKFTLSRYIVTKLTMLVSVIDDMYDVHGTIEELELFTSAIERWDTSMKDLPDYMRTCYDAIIDVLDEVDAITTKEGRPYCLEYAKEAHKNQVRAYLAEARWFAQGKVPTVEEYRRVGVYSCAYPSLACSALCGMGEKAPKEAFDWLFSEPKILVAISDHCRIMDDIVSHEFEQKRGHVASVVECYMKQYDVPRDEAVVALNKIVEHDWKEINKETFNQPGFVSNEVMSMLVGLAKVMEVLYKDFDSYTFSETVTKDMMTALLVTPMVLEA